MAADFKSLLSKPADEVKKPKPLPAGTYTGLITKYELAEAKNDRKTPFVQFFFSILSPGADVAAAYSTELSEIDLSKRQLRKQYYITDDALWRLTEFQRALGLVTGNGQSVDSILPRMINVPVTLSIIQKPSQDGLEIYNEIADVTKA